MIPESDTRQTDPDTAKTDSGDTATESSASRSRISRHRLWLFRLIAVTVIPAMVLAVLEISLRILGYGYPTGALSRTELNGQAAWCNNYRFGWRFWPRSIAREAEPFIFHEDKPAQTFRIFILGGSAALGTPEPSYSFSRILEVMLEERYRRVDFEVINTAITATNSHVVLPIARDCASHDPDLFIVYLGNNEVIGPYGAGTVFAPLSDRMAFIRLDKAIQTTRLGQLFKTALNRRHSDRTIPEKWAGSRMFMENLVRKDDANLQIVYRHFKRNLEDIVKTARKARAGIILCSVASNLRDSAPFASLHRPDLAGDEKERWDRLYAEGAAHESAGEHDQALRSFQAAAEIDSAYADLHFRMARAYEQLELFEKARREYILARELDALRLRADNRINEVIRSVAEAFGADGVRFVDSVKALEQHSRHNIPGEELFYEHVHLTFKGNYTLTEAVLRQVEAVLPEWITSDKTARPLPGQEICEERLAYTRWDEYVITRKILDEFTENAPFSGRLYNRALAARIRRKLDDLEKSLDDQTLEAVDRQYLQAIQKRPSDWWLRWKYARFLTDGLKDPAGAAEQYRIASELVPGSYSVHAACALAFLRAGKHDRAIAACLKALDLNPTCVDAHHILGISYAEKGQTDKALKHFSREIRIRPDRTQGYNRIGVILDKQGKPDKAEKIYRKGLTYAGGDVMLNYNLALLLARQKRFDEASRSLRDALKVNPDSPQLLMLLRKIEASGG